MNTFNVLMDAVGPEDAVNETTYQAQFMADGVWVNYKTCGSLQEAVDVLRAPQFDDLSVRVVRVIERVLITVLQERQES